jgi:hypothetical protein
MIILPIAGALASNKAVLYVAIALLVVFLMLAIAQFFLFPCPRCKANIDPYLAVKPSPFKRAANFCPYCGVSLDEPNGA